MSDTNNNPEWQPKYPESALHGGMSGAGDRFPGFSWTSAPEDSHLKEFRYVAGSKMGRVLGRLMDYRSFLFVRFKATATAPETEYSYQFISEGDGQAVFDQMVGHPDPGEVVWSDLIRKGVKYRKES